MLELAEHRVVVLNQPHPHEPGELVLLLRQVTPATGRSDELIDEMEMFEQQPLIVHADLVGNPPDYRDGSSQTQGSEPTYRAYFCLAGLRGRGVMAVYMLRQRPGGLESPVGMTPELRKGREA